MIKDYKIVFGDDTEELEWIVNVNIKDGYEPFGSVFKSKENAFCQAMIKREEKTSL